MLKTKNGKTVLSSKCAVCGSKVSRFMKEQESSGILSSLGLKTTLSKIPFYNDVFFKFIEYNDFNSHYQYRMNQIVNKVLLKGDKLVPEIHLQQLGFLNSILGWKGKITYPFFVRTSI